jgi:hypothetical protein
MKFDFLSQCVARAIFLIFSTNKIARDDDGLYIFVRPKIRLRPFAGLALLLFENPSVRSGRDSNLKIT